MTSPAPIAVVGAAGLFPGAADLDAFWGLITEARSAAAAIPPERADAEIAGLLADAHGVPDRMVSPRACLLPDFDVADLAERIQGAGMSPSRIDRLDPLYRLVLRVGADAWDDARGSRPAPERVGVVLANIALPTDGASAIARAVLGRSLEGRVLGRSAPAAWDEGLGADPLDRFVTGLPAALLARVLGFGGGSYTLDAACASSLYAVHLACEELRAGRLDAALAGGASRPDCLYTQIGFSQLRALSPSGVCSPFDARADGLVVGEGAGVFVLKRLDRALEDGDRVRAVLRGTGLSNDVGGSLLSPESEGQVRAMRAAYAGLDLTPEDVDLVECHGTGTLRGDAVELGSLRALFGDGDRDVVIGSVKSNVGHLLTGAGAAGLMKVLLALEAGALPPSAGFEAGSAHPDLGGSRFSVLSAPRAWSRRDEGTPRTAAVSAFGFGGINAHLVLQEWIESPAREPLHTTSAGPEPVAIVGMGARVGRLEDLDAVREAGLRGEAVLDPRPRDRWRGIEESAWLRGVAGDLARAMPGAWIEHLDLPLGRFRLPPAEMTSVLPQHLLMMQVVDAAVRDAADAWPDAGPAGARTSVGCVVGIGLDLETTGFHVGWLLEAQARAWAQQLGVKLDPEAEAAWTEALREALGPALDAPRVQGALGGMIASRIARELRLGGPCFAVSDEDGSGVRALEVGSRMLQRGEVTTAVVGGVDLAGDVRAALADDALRPWSRAGRARPFEAGADGPVVGEGAAALVLKPIGAARRDGDRIHAVIRGLGAAAGGGIDRPGTAPAYTRAVTAAWTEAGLERRRAGLIEAHASGSPVEDAIEAEALAGLFPGEAATTAVAATKGVFGHTGAAAPLLGVVRAALALRGRVLPPNPDFERPAADAWEGSSLHLPRLPQPWHHDRLAGPRTAGVSAVSVGGTCLHVVLAEPPRSDRSDPGLDRPLGDRGAALFLLPAADSATLGRSVARLRTMIGAADSVETIAAAWHRASRGSSGPVRAVTAGSPRELASRLTRLTPSDPGSRDLASRGRLAWIFPGSGNHFVGMGRDLALTMPRVFRGIDEETELLRSQLMPAYYGPWRREWSSGWEHAAAAALAEDPRRMIFGQVAHGVSVARALEALGVRPAAAIGYSLGESAALFATRAWTDRDSMFRRTMESSLFTTELSGPNTVAAAAWGGPGDWWPAVLSRPADVVCAALADLGGDEATTARLLIVNAPDECVVGGRRPDVERVADALGVTPRPLEGVPTVHCDVMAPVARRYRDLHVLPTRPPAGVRFYSGCWARGFDLTEASAADSIIANAMHGLDYPATIERAYADGVRIFVEAGPQGSCARMVGAILGDRPHLAVSACRKGRTGLRNLLEAVGACAEVGVPVDLDVLYGDRGGIPAADEAPALRTVRVGLGRSPRPVPAVPSTPTPARPAVLPTSGPTPAHRPPAVPAPPVPRVDLPARGSDLVGFTASPLEAITATSTAHATFLQVSRGASAAHASALALQQLLLDAAMTGGLPAPTTTPASVPTPPLVGPDGVPRSLDRARCMEFAVGSIAAVLGPRFAAVDGHPTRVRLPDEPLMFVDRITTIEGEPGSLGSGRCVTEHDVLPGAWYLDGGRVPVCVSVEAGQADLFLSAFLGIDERTLGLRVYRLLDAQVVFHRDLPAVGDVIRYDIHIDRFIKQGSTYLFFFRFEGWIGDSHLISMRDGCAGFFTARQLADGRGIVDPSADPPERRRSGADGSPATGFRDLVPEAVPPRLDEVAVSALRRGDLAAAFGPAFAGRGLHHGLHLPAGRMTLIHRVSELDPAGGAFGLGTVSTEFDVDPEGWYLTCHFVDDQVMPGTFMYEGCLHTLRVLLLRMGWIAPESERDLHYAPIPGIPSRLRCRGQVTSDTRSLVYRLDIKEVGYDPEPYVLADALMYGDGRCIVQFENVSYRLSGITREEIEALWSDSRESSTHAYLTPVDGSPFGPPRAGKPARYDAESILAFAVGRPSVAFGEPYLPFDEERRIARLPGPPLCFLDRVTELEPAPWVLEPGGWIEAEYDVPADAWYFAANRQASMPFAVILETALQPCGWLAAYLGSALRSEQDLRFRNLSGTATLHGELFADVGTVTTRVRLTGVSEAASMILQEFDFQLWAGGRILYEGVTRFGFFPAKALADQVGVRGASARAWSPSAPAPRRAVEVREPLRPSDVPPGATAESPGLHLPARAMSMLDHVEYHPAGGAAGLGWIRGSKAVVAEDWFFAAHFFQDPVIPGSLGLEAFLQLLKVVAIEVFGDRVSTHRFQPIAVGREHTWLYRGQVVPSDAEEAVEASITSIEDGTAPVITADGFLRVDGRIIYEMTGFALRLVPGDAP